MIKIIQLFICIFAVNGALLGQTVSIQQYKEEVYDYSYSIKSAAENSIATQHAVRKTRANLYPRIDALLNGTYSLREYSLLPGYDLERPAGSVGATLSQNIYSGGSVKNSVALARNNSLISNLDLLLTKENVMLAASLIYWHVVAAEEYVKVATQYLDIINKNYTLLEVKYSDGLISKSDLLMMQTRKKQAEYQLSQTIRNRDRTVADFNILRGKTANELVTLDEKIMVEASEKPQFRDNNSIIENRYEYQKAQSQKLQNQITLKINQSKYLPKISTGVSGTYGTKSLNFDNSLLLDGTLFLKISTPIFGWGERRQQKLADRARVRAAENNIMIERDNILKEINQAYISLDESYEQLDLTATTLSIADESLNLAIISFDEGITSIIELLTSQLAWISAYNNKIAANMNYRTSLLYYKKATATL